MYCAEADRRCGRRRPNGDERSDGGTRDRRPLSNVGLDSGSDQRTTLRRMTPRGPPGSFCGVVCTHPCQLECRLGSSAARRRDVPRGGPAVRGDAPFNPANATKDSAARAGQRWSQTVIGRDDEPVRREGRLTRLHFRPTRSQNGSRVEVTSCASSLPPDTRVPGGTASLHRRVAQSPASRPASHPDRIPPEARARAARRGSARP